MAILIAYTGKHGTTQKCANALKARLPGAEVWDLKSSEPDLTKYDAVILGGSVYAGMPRKRLKAFAAGQEAALAKKKLGLFLCCMADGEQAQKQMEAAYPASLLKTAAAKGVLGGGFCVSDMNFFEKFIVKKIDGKEPKDSFILRDDTLDAFVKAFGEN